MAAQGRSITRIRCSKQNPPTLPDSSLWSSLWARGCSKPSAGFAGFFRGGTGSARADAEVCAHNSSRLKLHYGSDYNMVEIDSV